MAASKDIIIRGIPQAQDLKDDRWIKLKKKYPKLPKPPFRMIVLGQSGSGKSSFVYSLLKKYYNKYFDQILIFSGTVDSNSAWGRIKDHEGDAPQIFNEYDPATIEEYLNQIEAEHAQAMQNDEHPNRILLVFDDLATDGISQRHRLDIMDKIFVQLSRHYNISVMILTQFYNSLNRNQRAINLSHLVVYPISKNDLELVAYDHSPAGMDWKQTYAMISRILNKKPYNYVVLDYTKTPDKRFSETLTKPIKITIEDPELKGITLQDT